MDKDDILDCMARTGALLSGHFELRSKLHSDRYFQCALLLRDTVIAVRLCGELVRRCRAGLAGGPVLEEVIAPALGGLAVGQAVATELALPFIFPEKVEGRLALRRGFRIVAGRPYLVAEDVVTRGGRVQETLDIVRQGGGRVAAVAAIVDRSCGTVDFGVPFFSLIQMNPTTWAPAECPLCRQGVPMDHPGS